MSGCFYCGFEDDCSTCSSCQKVTSCGRHWDIHRRDEKTCQPFTIRYEEDRGSYLVATRDIKPYEIILQDKPAIIGPFDDSDMRCLECHKCMSELYSCTTCGLPLCGKECESGPRHKPECSYLSGRKVERVEVGSLPTIYSAVAPIRLLQIMKKDKETWHKIDRLMDHVQLRRKEENTWRPITENVIPFLKGECDVEEETETIERMIGLIRTNTVKWEEVIGGRRTPVGHALCPLFSLLCHSCISNSRYTQTSEEITLRACVQIREGDEITIQYRGSNEGNVVRRGEFTKYWYFTCTCPRCQDPTELGTHSSTVRCPECLAYNLLPKNQVELTCSWECGCCGQSREFKQILDTVLRLERKVECKSYADSPVTWEHLLSELTAELHPDHYLCMKVKRILIQMYGAREGYKISEMTREQVERKLELCHNYMDIFSKLEPGYRTWRGRVLEEMLAPFTQLIKIKLESGEIGKLEYLVYYKQLLNMVKEAAKCRQFQENGGTDHALAGEFYKSWTAPIQQTLSRQKTEKSANTSEDHDKSRSNGESEKSVTDASDDSGKSLVNGKSLTVAASGLLVANVTNVMVDVDIGRQ